MSEFHATILSIFPEIFPGPLNYSLAAKALKESIWSYEAVNLRMFGLTKHKKVDDKAFGGDGGLILRPDVVSNAIDYVINKHGKANIYYLSPRGELFNQEKAKEIAKEKKIILLCGRFEGLDERVIEEYDMKEISMGDYILSGGEIAALALLDSVVRLLPSVVKNNENIKNDSFEIRDFKCLKVKKFKDKDILDLPLLEHPLYTKPRSWKNRNVPDVLLSGNHKEIMLWQFNKALEITKKRRPELLKKFDKNI